MNEIAAFIIKHRTKMMRTLNIMSLYFIIRQNFMANPADGSFYISAFVICLFLTALINAVYFISIKQKTQGILFSVLAVVLAVFLFVLSFFPLV